VLKRRARGKDDPYRVAFAHSVQAHLAERRFPVAPLVPTRQADTMLHLNNHIYELFEYVVGTRYDGSAAATVDAGRQLSRFHKHLADFALHWRPLRGSFHDSAAVRGHLENLGTEQRFDEPGGQLREAAEALEGVYDSSARRANELGFAAWAEQVVHGDWHPGNLLFSARRVTAVLDFDSIKMAAPATDVANAMLQFSIVAGRPNPADWPDYLDQAKLVQVLSGYQQVRPLPDTQVGCLPDLMIETMVAEAVLPVAATGFFGNLSGLDFLQVIRRKCDWINSNRETLVEAMLHGVGLSPS
jgi:Ser/Thr protein kinase RdoA (MazF antagonist)